MRIFSALGAATLALGLAACVSQAQRDGMSTYAQDAALAAWVKAAMLAEPSIQADAIGVDTFKNTVQLSGFVDSKAQIARAIEIASGVEGVEAVKNDMRVK